MFLEVEKKLIIRPPQKNVLNCKNDTPTAISPETGKSGRSKNLIRFLKAATPILGWKRNKWLSFFKLCIILSLYYLKLNLALPVSEVVLSPDPPLFLCSTFLRIWASQSSWMSWNQHWHSAVDVVFPSLAPFECKPDLHYSDTQQVSAGKHTHTNTRPFHRSQNSI